MRGGRLLLFLLFFVAPPPADGTAKDSNKYYTTFPIPHQRWVQVPDEKLPVPYKHEMVISGALNLPIRKGSNFSVHPTRSCDQKIGVVLQLVKDNIQNMADRARKMCTVSITIDDGHVEVWYGLCLTDELHTERKFDFSVNPMALVYFTFEKLTMRVYRREGDGEADFEMGRVEHVSEDPDFHEWTTLSMFLYHDACPHVNLKQVYDENDWRRLKKKKEDDKPFDGVSLARMVAIFSVPLAIGCFVLSLMHVWSMGVAFPTNGIFDAIFSRYNAKTGAIATADKEEQKSCRSAEEPSEEWEGTGKKENLFGDRGKRKALVRPPPAYIIPKYDAPYEDDPEPALETAIQEVDAPAITPPGSKENPGSKEKAAVPDPVAAAV